MLLAIFASHALAAGNGALKTKVLAGRTDLCACNYATVPFYRAYSTARNDNFYTTDYAELLLMVRDNGYRRNPDLGLVLNATAPGAVPLYRLWNGRTNIDCDHFYTTSMVERDNTAGKDGWVYEGVAAYVLPSSACGTMPVYRLFSTSGYNHFYTLDAMELARMLTLLPYWLEGFAGFIWPAV